jgi:2-phosphosulfolactate phosphatase
MTAALQSGVRQIRIFDSIDAVRAVAAESLGKHLLCGESNCLPPDGFDLGNSPGAFNRPAHDGKTLLMSTTNGTRAICAAVQSDTMMIGALTNASAVARLLQTMNRDVTLLCAGTNGQVALEDILGAGAVIDSLVPAFCHLETDSALLAKDLFDLHKTDLRAVLSQTQGGKNVIAAGLSKDIDFAARLNAATQVGHVLNNPLRVVQFP